MKNSTTHNEQLVFLKKIEGQIRGIQKMIEDGRYCVDILIQIRSIIGALHKVEDGAFKKHIDGCVAGALQGKSQVEKQKKIAEVLELISRFRKKA